MKPVERRAAKMRDKQATSSTKIDPPPSHLEQAIYGKANSPSGSAILVVVHRGVPITDALMGFDLGYATVDPILTRGKL